MQLRIGIYLSWLTAWVLALLLFWLSWSERKEAADFEKRKELADTNLSAGVAGLIASSIGALMLVGSRFTLMKNLVVNAGAWLGMAWSVFMFARGYTLYKFFHDSEQVDDVELAIALTNFILAIIFIIAALGCRGAAATDRGMYSVLHTAGILTICVAFMLFCWQLYDDHECRNDSSKSANDCLDEKKAWYSIIMIASYAGAGVSLASCVLGQFQDGVIFGTIAIGALFGSYISILLSVADGECDIDCQEDGYLSGSVIGGVASAVLVIFFCTRSMPQ